MHENGNNDKYHKSDNNKSITIYKG